jgi:two-component system nitrogen regulation response regulator GlnG
VRELENVIRRALVVGKGDALLPADLPPELTTLRPFPAPATGGAPSAVPAPGQADSSLAAAEVPALVRALFQHARRETSLRLLPAVERELVIQALQETRGNQVQAAKLLGITRSTLRKRIAKFGIKQDLSIG